MAVYTPEGYIEHWEDQHYFFEKEGKYLKIPMSFDIETTTKGTLSFMYIWQMGVGKDVVLGRKWDQWIFLLSWLSKKLELDPEKRRVIIWDHNFCFEFSFIKRRVPWHRRKDGSYDIFAMTPTQIVKGVTRWGFEFRDSLILSGESLAGLAKDYTKTQKLVGELDYTVPRCSRTKLTEEEKGYCINDVRILTEYSEYLYRTYGADIPLTKTAIVRRDLKRSFKSQSREDQKKWHDIIYECHPSERLYHTLMVDCYAGGYVHACYYYTGVDIIGGMKSFDFKSAYPSACFDKLPYKLIPIRPKDAVKHLHPESVALMMVCRFKKLEQSGAHAIFSRHKAMVGSEGVLDDNGRVRYAEVLVCCLTELDWLSFEKFYKWESVEIIRAWRAEKHPLPDYVLRMVEKYYKMKNALPKGTPEYALTKASLNSIYGMMVTSLFHADYEYDPESGDFQLSEKRDTAFWKLKRKALLLPQWGVWVSATCRHNLLSIISQIGGDAVYSDTDSAKVLHWKKHLTPIEAFNSKIMKRNTELLKKGYDIGKLGIFDDEGEILRFKTLGCKRYLTETEDGVKVTVAGMAKGSYAKWCKAHHADPFESFTSGLHMTAEESDKLRSLYISDPYTDKISDTQGHTEIMHEESGVTLLPVPFSMDMTEEYIRYADYERKKKERIIS